MPENSDENAIFQKLQTFCSYRERCSFEVQQKLRRMGINKSQDKKIIDKLKKEGFINDQRFAETYIRGKLFNNNWGKIKTRFHLEQLKVPVEFIKKGFESIEEEEYKNVIQKLIEKKIIELPGQYNEMKKNKIARYCIQKGFEPYLIWQMINEHKE